MLPAPTAKEGAAVTGRRGVNGGVGWRCGAGVSPSDAMAQGAGGSSLSGRPAQAVQVFGMRR